MSIPTKLEELVKTSMHEYPSLYGNHRLSALAHCLLGNGTGIEWTEDGDLEYVGYTPPEAKNVIEHQPEVHRTAMNILQKLPEATQVRVRARDKEHPLAWVMPEEAAAEAEAWHTWGRGLYDLTRQLANGSTVYGYMLSLARPPAFGDVRLDTYSPICRIPDNVKPYVMDRIIEVLTAVLTHREGDKRYYADNHINAITHLLRLHNHVSLSLEEWTKYVVELRSESYREKLALDIKRHAQNHVLDESRLDDKEFFTYHELCMDGLADEEVKLVRRFAQFRQWDEVQHKLLASRSNERDQKSRRELWQTLEILTDGEGSYLQSGILPDNLVNYAAVQKMIYKPR